MRCGNYFQFGDCHCPLRLCRNKDSMVNYLSGNKINGGMIVAGLVVLVLGIIFALLAYYLIRGFAVIVRHYEEDGSEVQGENFFEKLSQVEKIWAVLCLQKLNRLYPCRNRHPRRKRSRFATASNAAVR